MSQHLWKGKREAQLRQTLFQNVNSSPDRSNANTSSRARAVVPSQVCLGTVARSQRWARRALGSQADPGGVHKRHKARAESYARGSHRSPPIGPLGNNKPPPLPCGTRIHYCSPPFQLRGSAEGTCRVQVRRRGSGRLSSLGRINPSGQLPLPPAVGAWDASARVARGTRVGAARQVGKTTRVPHCAQSCLGTHRTCWCCRQPWCQ